MKFSVYDVVLMAVLKVCVQPDMFAVAPASRRDCLLRFENWLIIRPA